MEINGLPRGDSDTASAAFESRGGGLGVCLNVIGALLGAGVNDCDQGVIGRPI